MGPRGEPGVAGPMGPPGPQGPNGLSLPGEPVSLADALQQSPNLNAPKIILAADVHVET